MAAGDLNFNVGVQTSDAIRNVKNLNNALGSLTNAFRLTVAGISLGAIAKFSDEITSLKNRLMLLSDSQQQAADQFKGIAAIAIQSRTDIAATGDLYFRIARNAKELGISQQEAISITESLAKAMSASGASASESAGPLLQLGQALQAGVFQGDELRSILEGLPPVARALADQLGVPIGALKKMGSEGNITSQDFIKAMRKAKDAIEKDFAKTVPTIGSAFNELKASTALAFNEFEKSTQTGQNFATAIEYLGFTIYKLSQNIDQIIGPLTTFIKIAGALLAFTVVGRLLMWIVEIIGFFGSGLTMLITRFGLIKDIFLNFGKSLEVMGGGFLGLGKILGFVLTPIMKIAGGLLTIAAAAGTFLGLDKLFDWFKGLGDSNNDSKKELEDYKKELDKFKTGLDSTAGKPAPAFLDPEKMRKARQEMEQIVISYQRQNEEQLKRLDFENSLVGVAEQQKQVKQALFDLETNYLSEVNKLVDDYRKASESKNKEDQAKLPMIQKAIQGVSEAYAAQIEKVKELTNENFILGEAERQRLAISEFSINSQINNNKELQKLQDDMAKMTMSEIQKKYYDINAAARDNARVAIEAENARRRQMKLTSMSAEEEQKYYDEAKKGTDALIKQQGELYQQSRRFETGWTTAFNNYVDEATNAARQAENIFNTLTSSMEDMLMGFFKTGKLGWKDFLQTVIDQMMRSQIQQLIAKTFGGVGAISGSSKGGLLGGAIIPGFLAQGGPAQAGSPYVVGENGPEMFVPGTSGTVIPNNQLPNTASITYNINAVDAMSFKQMIAQDPSFLYAVTEQGRRRMPGAR